MPLGCRKTMAVSEIEIMPGNSRKVKASSTFLARPSSIPSVYLLGPAPQGIAYQIPPSPPPVAAGRGQFKKRKISKCMQRFLGRNFGGFDWSRPWITNQSPWGGRPASTGYWDGMLRIHAGNTRFTNLEADTGLFFHEIGHIPDWADGTVKDSTPMDAIMGISIMVRQLLHWVTVGWKPRLAQMVILCTVMEH